MRQGDFTDLAKNYKYRNGYSLSVLKAIAGYIKASHREDYVIADIGAGTGKLTENLIQLGFSGYAIEPNYAMLMEGVRNLDGKGFKWLNYSAEKTGLPDNSVDWILMGSSFHWTDQPKALGEFHRILKPNGFFTAIWNPRDIEKSQREQNIERIIQEIVPDLKRVSSGAKSFTGRVEETLLSTGEFHNVVFIEAPHEVIVTKSNYLGAWRSVNDIQAQAGEQKFQMILKQIEEEISENELVNVPYRTRSWTVQAKE